ncbi:MAG TPA: hypothetical protein VNX26_03975 [Candidatus Acidoferrum sp.]|nr:hypothetical protein [Candidatus Acidoferrum sp.]
MQQTFRCPKSIAGAALVVLGIFIFYENLNRAASQLSHLPGAVSRHALGILPAAILASPRVLQAYAADHWLFLLGLLRHMLVPCWPLLLVIAGTALSPDVFRDDTQCASKTNYGLQSLTARRSTLK